MQRADQRKYHYIYKITRDDGRYYVGMHSTDDLDDGYFGSGKKITRSVKAHGKERHLKEILEFLPTRKELKAREGEMITEEMRNDPLCMNLAPGGGGGFIDEEHREKWIAAGRSTPEKMKKINATISKRKEEIPGYAEAIGRKISESNKGLQTFLGKKHSEETKQKMRKSKNVGTTNSQFGTCWVTDGSKPIKIKKDQLDEYLANGYSRGRT